MNDYIGDYKYENNKLWRTKFFYQKRLVLFGEQYPEILEEYEKKEISRIKLRREIGVPVSLEDKFPYINVNISLDKDGKAIVDLKPKQETIFGNLFDEENTDNYKITHIKSLKPIVVVNNVPIVYFEQFNELCSFLMNEKICKRLWNSKPDRVQLKINNEKTYSTGTVYLTFKSPKYASMAVRKSNRKLLDKKHRIYTYIKGNKY